MSSLYSLLLVASFFPALLASATSQAMLVAAAVGAGVVAWVVWNALHSAPVAKYDPWENDRAFGLREEATRLPSDSFDDSDFGAAHPQGPSEPPLNLREPGGHATGSPLTEPVGRPSLSVEAKTTTSPPGDWNSGSNKTSDEVRAMLREIEDPETRRMLAESLKLIEAAEPE